MNKQIEMGFESEGVTLSLDAILPSRQVQLAGPADRYFKILTSIREIGGLVEPLVVFRQLGQSDQYVLLDGHWRLKALRELGFIEAFCIIAKDDEAFTYNHKINRLAIIQENAMILKALNQNVSEEKIARALNIPVEKIRASRNLLAGIHEDAVHLLRDKPITAGAIQIFKKVKASRQIQMARLMESAGNFSTLYAQALLVATVKPELLHPEKPKKVKQLTAEEIARLEEEMGNVERSFKASEDAYGKNILRLSVTSRYVEQLLANVRVASYLSRHHPEILAELAAVTRDQTLAA